MRRLRLKWARLTRFQRFLVCCAVSERTTTD